MYVKPDPRRPGLRQIRVQAIAAAAVKAEREVQKSNAAALAKVAKASK